jgi:hypothetical protein
MRAYKTSAPTGYVHWSVENAPDATGTNSGYSPGELRNITVSYASGSGGGGVSVDGHQLNKDIIEVAMTKSGLNVSLISPKSIIIDGNYMYVGQHDPYGNIEANKIWRFTLNGTDVTDATYVDLYPILSLHFRTKQAMTVRDIAHDATYLYATCWDTGQVAIIQKSTFTVVGWASIQRNVGNAKLNAVSVATSYDYDGITDGFFYVTSVGDVQRISKFETSVLLGQEPLNNVAASGYNLDTLHVRWVTYANGNLWVTGNKAFALKQINPVNMGLTHTVSTLGGSDSSMVATYAFGSIWVAMESGDVYRLDPNTYTTNAGYPITCVNNNTPGDIVMGPNKNGIPNTLMYISDQEASGFSSINPATNVHEYFQMGSNGQVEGIAISGNNIYFADHGAWAIDYFVRTTGQTGHLFLNKEQFSVTQKYTAISGDIRTDINNTKVNIINGARIMNDLGHANMVLKSEQNYFDTPSGLAYDSNKNNLWISDAGTSFLYKYNEQDNFSYKMYELGELNVNNIKLNKYNKGIDGIRNITINGSYLFATPTFSSDYSTFVIDLDAEKLICITEGTASNDDRVDCVIVNNKLWTLSLTTLDKYDLINVTDRKYPIIKPIYSIVLSSTGVYNTALATDGRYIYYSNKNGQLFYVDSTLTNPDTKSLWTHPFANGANSLKYANGFLWYAAFEGIYKIDVSNLASPVATLITGTNTSNNSWVGTVYAEASIWSVEKNTGAGMVQIDTLTNAVVNTYINSANDRFTNIYYNSVNNKLYLTNLSSLSNAQSIVSYDAAFPGSGSINSQGPLVLRWSAP